MGTPIDSRYEYGLDQLRTTDYFQTREVALNHFGVIHAYDPKQRVKKWAMETINANQPYCKFLALAIDMSTGATLLKDGKPYLQEYIMPIEVALEINIPPSDASSYPSVNLPEWPFPCRPLAEYEELAQGFGGVVLVRDKRYAPKDQDVIIANGFTEADRQMLKDIHSLYFKG